MKKYFDILGLQEGASQEAIQEAYDRLSIELDPKKNENQEFFLEEFEKLQEAYNALRNSSILSTEGGLKKTMISNKATLKTNIHSENLIKKSRIKSLFSKQNIIIILLTLSICSNIYLFININNVDIPTVDEKSTTATLLTYPSLKIPNGTLDEASSYANETGGSVDEASGYADDAQSYMNSAEEYMNNAEEYMNNAARSAQEAEEFANNR